MMQHTASLAMICYGSNISTSHHIGNVISKNVSPAYIKFMDSNRQSQLTYIADGGRRGARKGVGLLAFGEASFTIVWMYIDESLLIKTEYHQPLPSRHLPRALLVLLSQQSHEPKLHLNFAFSFCAESRSTMMF